MQSIRPLTPSDIDLICAHRHAMFAASGKPRELELAQMAEPFRAWLMPKLLKGDYFGFVTEVDHTPIASIGLMIIEWPPHPLHPDSDKRGYVLNMFVEPEFRRRGIAGKLLKLSEATFAERGIKYAVLHATRKGTRIYETNGWTSTPEMAKLIENAEL